MFVGKSHCDLEKLYSAGFDYVDVDPSLAMLVRSEAATLDVESCHGNTDGLYGVGGNPALVPYCMAWDSVDAPPPAISLFWKMVTNSDFMSHFVSFGSPCGICEVSVAKYIRGHSLAWHNDLNQNIPLNLAFMLNPDWTPDQGGALKFGKWKYDSAKAEGDPNSISELTTVEPQFGRLFLILNDPPIFVHEVTEVTADIRLVTLARWKR